MIKLEKIFSFLLPIFLFISIILLETHCSSATKIPTQETIQSPNEAKGKDDSKEEQQKQLKEVLEKYKEIIKVCQELGNQQLEADSYIGMGVVYTISGDYDNAILWLNRGLVIKNDIQDDSNVAEAFLHLGSSYNSIQEQDKANDALHQEEKYLNLIQTAKLSDLKNYQILLREDQRPLVEKLTNLYTDGIKVFGDTDAGLKGDLEINIGLIKKALGDYQEAVSFFTKGIETKSKPSVNSSNGLLEAYLHLSVCYKELGNQQESDKAFKIAKSYLKLLKASMFNEQGSYYDDQEQLDLAESYYKKCRDVCKELGIKEGISASYSNWAGIFDKRGNIVETQKDKQKYYQEALKLYDIAFSYASKDRERVAIKVSTATTYSHLGDHNKALELGSQSYELYKDAVIKEDLEAKVLFNIAREHEFLGNTQEALSYYQKSLPLRGKDKEGEAKTLFGLARIAKINNNFEQSKDFIEKAINKVEEVRSKVSNKYLRATYFAERQEYYDFYIDLFMQKHKESPKENYNARALEISERARARSLIESLTESRIKNETDISNKKVGFLTLVDIEKEVNDKDTLLIEYWLGSKTSYVWAVMGNYMESYELEATRDEIETLAKSIYKLLTKRQTLTEQQIAINAKQIDKDYWQQSTKLSNLLLKPLTKLSVAQRLIIVSDGTVNLVPFSALPFPEGKEKPQRKRDPVLESVLAQLQHLPLVIDYEVINVASVSAIAKQRQQAKKNYSNTNPIIVFAAPLYNTPGTKPNKNLAMPPSTTTRTGLPEIILDSKETIELPDLPFSEKEAENISRAVEGALLLIGPDANREAIIKGVLKGYSIVHFGTHAFADLKEEPKNYGLYLSRFDRESKKVVSFLSAGDISELDLSAELIVLANCQTAFGQRLKGEGVMALTRAFTVAGAKSLIGSLWIIRDEATLDLMTSFYQHLTVADSKGQLSPIAALKAAQIDTLVKPKYQSPFYWAAFTFQGEWRERKILSNK